MPGRVCGALPPVPLRPPAFHQARLPLCAERLQDGGRLMTSRVGFARGVEPRRPHRRYRFTSRRSNRPLSYLLTASNHYCLIAPLWPSGSKRSQASGVKFSSLRSQRYFVFLSCSSPSLCRTRYSLRRILSTALPRCWETCNWSSAMLEPALGMWSCVGSM